MKRKTLFNLLLALGLVLALGTLFIGLSAIVGAQGREPQSSVSAQADPVGTAFTYQGRLTDGGSLADGTYDFRFRLYDAASGGNLIDTEIEGDVTVTDGLFTVDLDFGEVFTGTARYLAIGVRPGSSTGAYTNLSPRQELTPAPYALALPGLWTQQNISSTNLIGGYGGNEVTDGVYGATIGGGGASGGDANLVTDNYGTVGGGIKNQAGDNAGTTSYMSHATVGGGTHNTASGGSATVGGGQYNTAGYYFDTVGGGGSNRTGGPYATVGGGGSNTAGVVGTVGGGSSNTASGGSATVGGGSSNTANGYAATVGGGGYNQAAAEFATIAGGGGSTSASGNLVTDNYGTVGGGVGNQAGDGAGTTIDRQYATVGGGQVNTASGPNATVGGGYSNTASSSNATVGGGHSNVASGDYATVGGGRSNTAQGQYSFAAGRRAKANNDGCFVWGDSYNGNVECNNNNRWVARASGGVYFYTNTGLTLGSRLLANGTSWGALSARQLKENFALVDGQELLARLAENPITTWNYKAQDPSIRHIGPMAEDFNALLDDLGGEGEEYINSLDADGVALAAIQALYQRNQELEAENAAQQQQIDELEARLAALEALGTGGTKEEGP